MKYIGYKNPHPKGEISVDLILIGVNENQTPEEVLASIDESYNAKIFDDSDFPASLNELPFWNYDGQTISYDLEKFRESVRNRLRSKRESILIKLDVDFIRALEEGTPTTEIVAEKQRLRNITTIVDGVNSIDELRALDIG